MRKSDRALHPPPGGRVELREGLEEAFVWHTAEEVAVFAARGMLHAGFEEAAIRDFAVLTAADQLRPLRASRRLDCTS